MADAYLGLGSNMGDKRAYLRQALDRLSLVCAVKKVSSLYVTEPVGNKEQNWFLNAAVHIGCEQPPAELLSLLLAIEHDLGRVRSAKNAPRTIDIDLLFYGDLVLESEDLAVPHPRLHERRFVLAPLAEIAPDLMHPVLGRSIQELADTLESDERVERLAGVWYSGGL
jgi:2-amino-4-hydroxy-6-hydroxymethyldihydropteridine diphosphokinase